MPVVYQKLITRADVQANSRALYAFGDNEQRRGLGGQAREMRGQPNAVGIATKASPYVHWREDDAARQNAVIDWDMARLFGVAKAGGLIVLPLDGIGTGLADLERQAPSTFAHLQTQLDALQHCADAWREDVDRLFARS